MNTIIAEIKDLALNGDSTANAIFKEIAGMSDKELAWYLGNDAKADKVAERLGVKYLVKKDANQALAKDFYELRNRGRQMMNPDRGQMLDVYNEKLKDVPYYMEKFGLPTEQGKYRVEDQIKFVKNIDKLDPIELQNLANQEGFATADQMRNEIKRTGERLIGDIARKGLNPETGGTTLKSVLRSAASLAAPRIVEAQEMGQDPSWKDVVGDEIELGLNLVPGMSVASKGARVLSKFNRLKNLPNSALARIAGGATEMVAAPGGSQLYDASVYDNEDPRGQLDWKRFTAQAAGGLAGFGTIKAFGAQGKNILEGTAGKAGTKDVARSLMNVAANIGNDAKENIARRQLVMERKAELAKNPQYNSQRYLTAEQNRTGHFATADDLADAEDFAIKKAEAERLANTQKIRQEYDNLANSTGLDNIKRENIANNGVITYKKPDGSVETLEIDPAYINMDEDALNNAIAEAWAAKHPDIDQQMTEKFGKLFNYGDNEIIFQLPDGRFVKGETVFSNPKGEVFANEFDNGIDASNLTLLQNNQNVTPHEVPGVTIGDDEVHITYKPRDYTVRRELKKDPDFDAVASGRAEKQPFYNTAAYAGLNAAAREGVLSDNVGIGMDEKRETALWNRQLDQLRPLVQQGEPEYKRQMVDAIMNVMTYGEDLPEEMYKQNRNAYDAIAQKLGISYNNSFKGVADYPTTSYSSAR